MSAKDPVAAAMASPDPVIRGMALRRKAIDDEAQQLDGFLSIYSAHDAQAPSVLAPPAPRIIGDFIAMARATLREAGGPLPLARFYKAFWDRVPEQTPITKESFRQRLFEQRDQIALLDDRGGYWLAGEPVPEQRRAPSAVSDAR